MSTKVIFNPAEVSFFWRKSVFRDVRMQSCLALRFLVTLRPPLHEIFVFLSNIRLRLACMRTSPKTHFYKTKDLRSSKNNFRGHDISQGLDREPLSLSPHFLLIAGVSPATARPFIGEFITSNNKTVPAKCHEEATLRKL